MRITANEAKERALLIMRNCMARMQEENDRKAHISYGAAIEWADLYYDITGNFLMDDSDEFYEILCKYETTYV